MQATERGPSIRELLSLKTTVSPKMQITIPMKLARLYGVQVGDIVRFTRYESNALTQRLVVEFVRGGKRYQTFWVRARQRAVIALAQLGS